MDCPVFTLCRGWDDLFNKCSENLNSLVAMKMSPYYKGWCSFYVYGFF